MKNPFVVVALLLGCSSSALRAADAPPDPQVEHARAVLAALVEAGKKNKQLPLPADAKAGQAARRSGDDLTAYYFREAAAAAQKVPAEHQAAAFLLALGIGLDDDELMRKNPVTRNLWLKIESDEERKKRLEVIGEATVQGRHDLCQHFVVSCALTAYLGAKNAENAGILKEMLDSRKGGSGFSFCDLSADLAGVTFARQIVAAPKRLAGVQKSFVVADFTLSPKGLQDDLSAEDFAKEYGGVTDKRFLTKLEALRADVLALPGYKAWEKEKDKDK
jgi:hypothetical protein